MIALGKTSVRRGPQFKSGQYLSFLRYWDISHGRSSPNHPQSIGYAEVSVKSMKKLIAGSSTAGFFDLNKLGKEFSSSVTLLLLVALPLCSVSSIAHRVTSFHPTGIRLRWSGKKPLGFWRSAPAAPGSCEWNNTIAPHPPPLLQYLAIGDILVIQHQYPNAGSDRGGRGIPRLSGKDPDR